MKSNKIPYIALLLGLLIACNKDNNALLETINPYLDTLKGEWSWDSTYDAKKGMIKNEYESSILFISENSDSTINFETVKDGIIEKKGKLKISNASFGAKMEPNILTNFTILNEIYFEFLNNKTLKFYEHCNDCSFYYYSKK